MKVFEEDKKYIDSILVREHGKSTKFVKERYNLYHSDNLFDCCCNCLEIESKEIIKNFLSITDYILADDIHVIIDYDNNANFDYYTYESCCCDGTYCFAMDCIYKCFKKVALLETYYNKKQAPEYGKTVHFTIGNIVLTEEFDKTKFSSKEKPWIQTCFTTFLPIKYDIY